MLGESTRAELGFDLLNLSGESASWAYPGWYIPISSPRVRLGSSEGFHALVGEGESEGARTGSLANSEIEETWHVEGTSH